MSKKNINLNKGKTIILIIAIILIALLIAAVVIFIPIILSYILGLILSSDEGYLLTGLSFCICGSLVIILVPIVIFSLISNKKNTINDIKNCFKKYKIFSIVVISIIAFLEIAIIGRGYTYYQDIKIGPQEVIMMDAVVKRKHGYRSSYSYIVGYINGEEIQLEITRDARSKVSRNKRYKMVKIKYYKNIKEIYDIDVYISYKENK